MKNAVKWIVLVLLLAAIIVGATMLYNKYKSEYSDELPKAETTIKAPDFTVFDTEGKAVKLSDFRGKPVVLNFWATWCYYCKKEMPDFNAAAEKYPEVEFLMVNATDGVQETEAKARQYVKENGYTFNVYFDTRMDAVYNYGVNSFPTTYFIDENGNIVAGAGGMIDAETLEDAIAKIK